MIMSARGRAEEPIRTVCKHADWVDQTKWLIHTVNDSAGIRVHSSLDYLLLQWCSRC